jgi:putative transcriptional regulator
MSKLGRDLIASLEQAVAHARGKDGDVRTRIVMVPVEVDVKSIRRKLRMSQRDFANRFGFSLGTLQNWERGHRRPEGAARVLLKVIEKRPKAVIEALSSR